MTWVCEIQELDKLLRRGIAYHHAGMLPILREYVELLFQVLHERSISVSRSLLEVIIGLFCE